ncbi:MAG: dihydropteroate synthase [Planctomycetota bacterium]
MSAERPAPPDELPRSAEFLLPGRIGADLALGPARQRIMGIVNLTPDSFSDGGLFHDARGRCRPEKAVRAALRLEQDGADVLDLGAESNRPGADPVAAETELQRLIPVLEALRPRTDLPISIDTKKAEVARIALEHGADWINDVSALRHDPEMGSVVAASGASVVLMHMRGSPKDMQEGPRYDDCLSEVKDHLGERAAHAERLGIPSNRILLDPGIGFGKRLVDNLALIRGLPELRSLGYPICLGASRKSFLGMLLAGERAAPPPAGRDAGTLAVLAFAHAAGVSVHRVHHVRYARDMLLVLDSIGAGRRGAGPG